MFRSQNNWFTSYLGGNVRVYCKVLNIIESAPSTLLSFCWNNVLHTTFASTFATCNVLMSVDLGETVWLTRTRVTESTHFEWRIHYDTRSTYSSTTSKYVRTKDITNILWLKEIFIYFCLVGQDCSLLSYCFVLRSTYYENCSRRLLIFLVAQLTVLLLASRYSRSSILSLFVRRTRRTPASFGCEYYWSATVKAEKIPLF